MLYMLLKSHKMLCILSFVEYLSSISESMANKNTRHRGEPGACFCLDGQKRERPAEAKSARWCALPEKFGGEIVSTTAYIDAQVWARLLDCLMPENRLALEISIATGLRISDVLALPADIKQRPTVRDKKTGKSHRVYFPDHLYRRMQQIRGEYFIFPNRNDEKRHRVRQSVWADLRRAATLYRLPLQYRRICIAPHSARKTYAVAEFRKSGSMQKVQKLLCHSDPSVTALYALADHLTQKQMYPKARMTE